VEPETHDYLENEDKLKQDFEDQVGKATKVKAVETAQEKLVEEGYETWFCCDGCMDPIPEQMFRFDCLRCDNFSFCQKCYKANTTHVHRFKK